jgi:hypothetical protein
VSLTNRKQRAVLPQSPELFQEETPERKTRDRLLLIVVALLVCAVGVGSGLLILVNHLNPVWFFFAWNSILMVPLFISDFRSHLSKPSFVAYLISWAVIHGLLVATLMRWLSIVAMIPLLAIELTVGLVVADFFFDIRPAQKDKD